MSLPAVPQDDLPVSLELAAARPVRGRRALLLFGGWTLYGLVFAALWTATAKSELKPEHMLHQLGLSILPAWLWAACTPLIVRTTRRMSPARVGWVRAALAHVALALAIAFAVSAVRRLVNGVVMADMDYVTPFWVSFSFWIDHNLFTYAVVAGVVHSLDLHRRWLARARRELSLQAELARTKLQFLRRQLQPHFLFNCLNATAELAREEPLVAQRMLRHLQRLLRAAFAGDDAEEVPLREELATLEPYVELQRMRFGDTLRVERRIAPAALDARVPALVLQPLVENAIQHGLTTRPGGGRVEIVADVVGERLHLFVRDDGPGPRATERRGGIGLRNTRDRLAQLYGEGQHFTLEHEGGMTVAALDLPFRPATTPRLADEPFAAAVSAHPATSPAADAAPASGLPEEEPEAVAPPVRPATWLALAGFWIAVGGLWIVQNAMRQWAGFGAVHEWRHTTIDFWTAVVWALLTPVVLLVARRARLTGARRARAIAVHLAAALAVDVAHLWLLLHIVARLGLMERPLVNGGNVSQFVLNLVIYAGLVTWSHGRDFSAWHRARVLGGARLDTALAQARWQSLALQLRPEFLLAVLERVAQLAPEAPAHAERLVERLADFLRETLDTVGHPMQPLRAELALLDECLALFGQATSREVSMDVDVPAGAMERPVSPGAFRALTNQLLAHEPAAGVPLRLRISTATHGARLALRLTSSVRLRPGTGDAVPAWTNAVFTDAHTAELDLGSVDGARPATVAAPHPVPA